MPNFEKHVSSGAKIGILAGLILNTVHQFKHIQNGKKSKFDLTELVLSGVGGAVAGTVGGILPDKLEPAYDPNHRKFFHSITMGTALGFGLYPLHKSNLPDLAKGILTVGTIGYLSHLALDSQTPKGLPLI